MKQAREHSHLKSVSVWVLMDKQSKEIQGKILANWSDNPNGSVCTCDVILWECEKYGLTPKIGTSSVWTGKAGGYGYCKFSTAVHDAINRNVSESLPRFAGAGHSAVKEFFGGIGIDAHEIF